MAMQNGLHGVLVAGEGRVSFRVKLSPVLYVQYSLLYIFRERDLVFLPTTEYDSLQVHVIVNQQ